MKKLPLNQVLHFTLPSALQSILPFALPFAVGMALVIAALPLHAQEDAPGGRERGGASQIHYQPPSLPNAGAPGSRRRGGASRTGSCPAVAQPLTALVPTVKDAVWGLTTAANPTLWFYVPYALNATHPAEFALLDDRNQYVYQTTLANAQTEATGIVEVALPSTVSLEVGKSYRWALTVNCGADSSVFVIGGIQRVVDPSGISGDSAASLDRASLYAENGIWFDALTTLAELKQAKPNDATIAAEWQSLLQSVTLEDVANQPFVPSH